MLTQRLYLTGISGVPQKHIVEDNFCRPEAHSVTQPVVWNQRMEFVALMPEPEKANL